MSQYRIGDMTEKLGLSADTLRYYERIGLLNRVSRDGSGIRLYNDKDLSRLKFIQRAQKMNFSLVEIAMLLKMREAPQRARPKVRELTGKKVAEIEARLAELQTLRDELRLLLNLCLGAESGNCPIIESIGHSQGGRSEQTRALSSGVRRRRYSSK